MTGIIFGLGLSELVLILVFVILILGPKRMKTIKPFMKVAYKNYLKYMKEVDAMQGEMDDMKKTLMEPIEEVKNEAVAELKDVESEMSEGMEGAEEIKKGMRALVERSKKEMAEAKAEMQKNKMEIEGTKPGKKVPFSASHMARGSQVGLLGKQGPGSSRRVPGRPGQQMQGRPGLGRMQGSRFNFNQGQRPSQSQNPPQRQQPVMGQNQPVQKEAPAISAAGAIHVEGKPVKKEMPEPAPEKTGVMPESKPKKPKPKERKAEQKKSKEGKKSKESKKKKSGSKAKEPKKKSAKKGGKKGR